MKTIDFEAQERTELGKKNASLRKRGIIPAIVYGHGFEPIPISVPEKAFLSLIGSASGSNVIINLKVGGSSFPVITHDISENAISSKVIHIDFMRIRMDEAIKAKVPIELMGIPVGVKDEEGILVHVLREIEVKCLPTNIPEKIVVDVTELKIGQNILVSDLKAMEDIEFITLKTEAIASVSAPTKEEVVEPPAAEGVAALEAGAVPAEGEAATPAAQAKTPAEASKAEKPAKEAVPTGPLRREASKPAVASKQAKK